jgi:hypothetical protein
MGWRVDRIGNAPPVSIYDPPIVSFESASPVRNSILTQTVRRRARKQLGRRHDVCSQLAAPAEHIPEADDDDECDFKAT